MHPILFEIGPVTIYSVWFLAIIGIIVGAVTFIKLAKENSSKLNFILDNSVSILLIGVVLARVVFIIKNAGYYFFEVNLSTILSVFQIWDKGLSAWGGIIGITLALIYFCKRDDQPIKKWLDVLFVSVMVGMIFGNVGTFMEGSEGYGKETDLPWGVKLEGPTVKYTIPVHPTQIYAAIYIMIISIVFIVLFTKKTFEKDGDIFVFGTLTYASVRFLDEFLRGDDVLMFIGLREGQILSLLTIITIGIYLLIRYNKVKFPKIKLR